MNRKFRIQDRLSYLFVLIALILLFASGYNKISRSKVRKAEIEEKMTLTKTDFADVKDTIPPVKQDTSINRVYEIRNIGFDTLKILFVSPDCNCTGYTLSSHYAAPGKSVELGLEIDMKNKHIGKYMLNTVVGMNTEKRLYRIQMKGEVLP